MTEEILLRYVTKKANASEIQLIADWISESDENKNQLFEMERIWIMKDELKYSQREKLDQTFANFAQKHLDFAAENSYTPPRKVLLPQWLMYVASVAIISVLSIGTYRFATISEPNYVNVETAKSQRSKLTLSDGSVVWLNADSKLTYSDQFGKDKRQVKLEGEAFFEVAKDPQHPFVVNSQNLDITVLGTTFNVKAYNGDISAIVSLKTGKVQVENKDKTQKIDLYPNQQLIYEAGDMKVLADKETSLALSWLSGELHFDNEPLANIVKTLERQFDVRIVLSDKSMEQMIFTCRVRQNASVTDVLELLTKTGGISYRINKSEITIY